MHIRETDIAIIGMSCVFPGAEDLAAFWNNILHKVDATGIVPEERLDPVYFDTRESGADRFYCNRGGFIPEVTFDPVKFGILPLAVSGTEPDHLLTLNLACKALQDAGLWHKGISLERTGIIIGKGNYAGPGATRAIEIVRTGEQIALMLRSILPHLSEAEIDKVKKEYQQQKGRFSADTAMGLIPNLVASLVANRLNLGGVAYTLDAACASSLLAVDHAVQEINNGRCDMVIAGGVHIAQNAAFWSIFSQLGALSATQQIKPFDKKADGLLIGEGCGFVVLKKLKAAVADKNKIYAVIKGVGVSSDGNGTSVMSPSVKGQTRAILQAWSNAGLSTKDIGYIEAHGTGTPLGDQTELETLAQVFGHDSSLPKAGIGTVKSNIGHAMPAAGIAGLIKAALALYHSKLPPTLHCDDPLDQFAHTQFKPVQDVADWDTSGLPKVAGVNAFGFGGINAHVVLQGFEYEGVKKEGMPLQRDKVLLLARRNKEELLQALEQDETETGTGDYRIALFDPTPERIKKAIKIVTRDTVWRNKQDIWFTNKPLLADGAKIAFVFPGLDGLAGGEINSVAAYFNLPMPHSGNGDDGLLHQALQVLDKSSVLDSALKQLGVAPDLNAGHSLGEWLAARSSELATESSVISLLRYLDPETFELKDSRFIAVGCGMEVLRPIMKDIPDLYLSNDNCPNQVVLCGTYKALDQLMIVLKEKQVFHQVLPFQSGFHSPFVADKLEALLKGMDDMQFQKTKIPLWSATTLHTYPETPDEIKHLSIAHLINPVRFRELTTKLYEEGVRVFIQVGSGGLTGFIDDTLKGKAYSAVSANVPIRSGITQLQRVLAALFIEGHEVNLDFMGISIRQPVAKGMKLQLGLPLVKDFPGIRPAVAPAAFKELSLEEVADPVMRAMKENVDELLALQTEMIDLFRARDTGAVRPVTNNKAPAVVAKAQQERKPFVSELNINLEDQAYLLDHSLLRQPKGWSCVEDMDPVIPMTMILELFAEAALAQAPETRVHQITQIKVFQWMNVAQPFREPVKGSWKSREQVALTIDKYAEAEVSLLPQLPVAPQLTPDIGKQLEISITPEQIYEGHMFHGPGYQGIRQVTGIGDKGINGIIAGGAGKGSLLDNAGQLFGLWLQLTLPKDRIAFPVKIKEITFYQPLEDQHGSFECTCVLTELNDEFATADFVMKRDGEVWATLSGWQNRRLEIDEPLWAVSMSPLRNRLSQEVLPGIFLFHNAYSRVVSWDFILKRYFNQEEKKHYRSLPPNKRKEWMISRVAVKDAVRTLINSSLHQACYPIEFAVQSDALQRPFVTGGLTEGIHISLAHKDLEAVAIAAHSSVGIDIELIAERSEGFMSLSFTEAERLLLQGRDVAEWSTRFWVAKEAYGKMLGQGLKGNPKAYEVRAVNDEELIIDQITIKTTRYKNYIIGWTQSAQPND